MGDPRDLKARLGAQESEDLIAILRQHDRDEWEPEVFDIARRLLAERGIDVDAALSAAVEKESSEPVEDLEAVASFTTVTDAESCRSALTAAGFDVFSLNENTVGVDPVLWPVVGGVRIAVPESQADEAREFLAAASRGDLASAPELALQCPACGSSRVRFVSRPDRAAALFTGVLTGFVGRSPESAYVCDDCGASS